MLEDLGLADRSASRHNAHESHEKKKHVRRNSDGHEPADDITLEQFLMCPDNPALNRQARMLAVMPCHTPPSSDHEADQHDVLMLTNAMHAVHEMPFFAVNEYPQHSMQLFEWTFGVKSSVADALRQPVSHAPTLTMQERMAVRSMNMLDVMLYEYAVAEFKRRLEACSICDQLPA